MPQYERIISLVPSLTELLIDLNLKKQLIGRTRFCLHPKKEVEDIEIIGGTKNPNIEKIVELDPDFILANKEENRKKDIDELSKFANVQVTVIDSVNDALIAIHELGHLLERDVEAAKLITDINEALNAKPEPPVLRAVYLIWKNPWMTVGRGTYIHDVMQLYSLENVFGDQRRYPKTTLEEIQRLNPDLILLSSEPYPFKEKQKEEIQGHFPSAKVELVNGEWFSWYGSRMKGSFEWLNEWRQKL